jgi:hypothetical protein
MHLLAILAALSAPGSGSVFDPTTAPLVVPIELPAELSPTLPVVQG